MRKSIELLKSKKILILSIFGAVVFAVATAGTLTYLQSSVHDTSKDNAELVSEPPSLEEQASAKLIAGDNEGALALYERVLEAAVASDPNSEKVSLLTSKIEYVKYDIERKKNAPQPEGNSEKYNYQTVDGVTEARPQQ